MHPIQGEDPLSHSGGKEVQATRGYDLADHPEMEQARRSALNTQHAGCAPCQAHHATQHGPAPGSKSSTPRKIGAKIIHHQTPGAGGPPVTKEGGPPDPRASTAVRAGATSKRRSNIVLGFAPQYPAMKGWTRPPG